MAAPQTVNPMITNAVAQNAGDIYLAIAQGTATVIQNAVAQQQQIAIALQAAADQAINTLLGIDAADTGVATRPIFSDAATPGDLQQSIASARQVVQTALGGDQPSAKQASGVQPVDPHPAIEQLLIAIRDTNAINMQQSIRMIELAAVTTIVARAARVNAGEPGAQEQIALWTGLMETVIRDFNAWAESVA